MTVHDAYRATLDHARDLATRFRALAWLAHEALERFPARPQFTRSGQVPGPRKVTTR